MVALMPDELGPASEFGGKVQENRVQPLPHVPTPSERMMLLYTTGDESGMSMPDDGETFQGLRPYATQLAKRTSEGVMNKGQVWEELQIAAAADQQEIKSAQQPDE